MFTAKAVARGLLLLLPLSAGCLSDSARPNTLPKRTATTMSDSSPAFASRTPVTPRTNAGLTSPAYRSPYLTAPAPTPSALAGGLARATPPPPALAGGLARATPPQPRVPEFNSQPPAANGGGFEAMAEGPAVEPDPKPQATPDPKPDPIPTASEPTPSPAPAPTAAETSRAKIPPLPGSEQDPPPTPGNIRTPAPSTKVSDDSTPPPIPSVVKPSPPQAAAPDASALPQLRDLHKKAVAKFADIDSYIARLRRREQINGKDKPEELMLFKFRKAPWSVYFKWLGIEGHNRECVYVKNRYGNMIHTLLAEGDVPFMPAGKRISLAPDSTLVRARSRHSITDAGIGEMIEKFGMLLDALERGDKRYGTMKYLGTLRRPEFEKSQIAVEQLVPPGAETTMPHGGSRLWLFDPDSNLPVLLVTTDHTGHEVEYYCYDQLQYPVKLDDDDFNPDRIWRTK